MQPMQVMAVLPKAQMRQERFVPSQGEVQAVNRELMGGSYCHIESIILRRNSYSIWSIQFMTLTSYKQIF